MSKLTYASNFIYKALMSMLKTQGAKDAIDELVAKIQKDAREECLDVVYKAKWVQVCEDMQYVAVTDIIKGIKKLSND